MTAYIIKTSGEKKEVKPKNGTDFKLAELQAIVGGYIEVVPTKDGKIMIVNEEGKLHGLELNPKATELLGFPDIIVGDVLVCDDDMVR